MTFPGPGLGGYWRSKADAALVDLAGRGDLNSFQDSRVQARSTYALACLALADAHDRAADTQPRKDET